MDDLGKRTLKAAGKQAKANTTNLDLCCGLEPLNGKTGLKARLCDVISKWETALREKGSGKFENSRVIRLTYRNRLYFKHSVRSETDKERLLLCYQINQQVTYRNRLYFKHSVRSETDKERLLLCYQINQQVVAGRFPVTRELAAELGALMAQLDMGDHVASNSQHNQPLAHRFYPYRYRAANTNDQLR
ncbi:FERM central domain-containing protein [Phthorimaea operculella]|nr:FERM central domain-containing protein [Phthorimaea operculella]